MSTTTIDNKVVEMQFDNRDFETNANASIKTLDKLKDALKLEGANRGFANVQQASDKMNFSGVASAIQTVSTKFSAMEVAAITAISNITNRAVDAGVTLAKSLSVDQITQGFSKYSQTTTSVGTIMAATRQDFADAETGLVDTAKQMTVVNEQLEKLNTYTDETSYNFTDMVSNIGKFTSAGIKLEDAVNSMMGIANWAGISGANSEQASRAMYNLAQSLGTGSVRLQDWMSIENANMATVEFKQAAIDAAMAEGTLTKAGKTLGSTTKGTEKVINQLTGELEIVQKTTESQTVTVEKFRDTLSDGWLTSKVLTTVLKNYGDFSNKLIDSMDNTGIGATKMLRYIDSFMAGTLDVNAVYEELDENAKENIGSVDELTKMFEDLSAQEYELGRRSFKASQEAKTLEDAINSVKDAASTRWLTIFQTIFGDYEQAKKLWTDLAEELYTVFIEPLWVIQEEFEEWAEEGGRDLMLEGVAEVWENLKNIIGTVKEAFETVFPEDGANKILAFTKAFKDFADKTSLSSGKLALLGVALRGVFTAFKTAGYVIKQLVSVVAGPFTEVVIPAIKDLAGSLLGLKKGASATTAILKFGTKMSDIYNEVTAEGSDFNKMIEKMRTNVTEFLRKVIDKIIEIWPDLKKIFTSAWSLAKELGDSLMNLGKTIGPYVSMVFGALVKGLGAFVSKVSEVVSKIKNSGFGSVLGGVLNFFKGLADGIKNAFEELKYVKTDPVGEIAEDAERQLSPFGRFLKGLQKLWEGFVAVLKKLKELFSTIIGLIGDSLGFIGERMGEGADKISSSALTVGSIGVLLGTILGTIWSKFSSISMFLSSARETFAELSSSIGGFFDSLSNGVNVESILRIAGALLAIAVAVAILASLPWQNVSMVAAEMAVLMAVLFGGVNSVNATSKVAGSDGKTKTDGSGGAAASKMMLATAASLLIMAAAMKIMIGAVEELGNMDTNALDKGLAAFSWIFGLVMGYSAIIGYANITKNSASKEKITAIKQIATSLVILGAALKIISKVVHALGVMKPEQVIQGLKAIGLILAGLAAFVVIVNGANSAFSKWTTAPSGIISACLSLVLLAAALNIAVKAVAKLGEFDPTQLTQGVQTIAILTLVMSAAVGLMALASKFGSGLSIGIGVLSLAASLSILANVVMTLGEFGKNKLERGLKAMSIMMLVLTAAFSVAALASQAGSGVGAGLGLLLMAAALNLLVPALLGLEKVKWESIGKAALIVAALGVAGAVAGPGLMILGASFALLGIGVSALAKGLISLGVGLLSMVPSLLALSAMSSVLVPALQNIGNAIITTLKTLVKGFASLAADFVVSFIMSFLTAIPDILDAAKTALDALAKFVAENIATIGTIFVLIFKMILEKLVELAPQIVDLIATLFGLLWDKLVEFAPKLVDFVGYLIELLIVKAEELLPRVLGLVIFLIDSVISYVETTLPRIVDMIFNTLDLIIARSDEFVAGVLQFILNVVEGITTAVPEIVGMFGQMLVDILTKIGEYTPQIVDAFLDIIVQFLNGIGEKIPDVVQAGWDLLIDLLDGIADGIEDNLPTIMEKGADIVVNLIEGLAQGIEDNAQRITDAVHKLCNAILNAFKTFFGIHSPSTVMADQGEFLAKGVGQGIEDGWKFIKDKVAAFGGKILDGIKGAWETAKDVGAWLGDKISEGWENVKEVGKNVATGLANGIESGAKAVANTAKNVATSAVNGIKNVLGIHSPSRVMAEVGKFMDQGLANGLTDYATVVNAAGEDVGDSAIESVAKAIQSISDEEIDADPTIRPVLDLSDVTSGVNALDSMLGGKSVSLAAEANGSVANTRDLNQNGVAVNNTSVVSAIDTLREEVNALSKIIGSMQVVMDTGELVGSLTAPMDAALGKQLAYGSRGM